MSNQDPTAYKAPESGWMKAVAGTMVRDFAAEQGPRNSATMEMMHASLSGAIERLEHDLRDLHVRLGPVMTPASPVADTTTASLPPCDSPLAVAIRDQARRVLNMVDLVTEIEQRLEI